MARAAVLAPWFRSYRICIAHHQGPNAHAAPCAMCQQLHTLHTLADETQARPRRSSSPGHQAAAAMPDREPRSARDRPPTHHSLARRCESIATTRLAVPLLPCAHPHTLTQSHTHTITHSHIHTFTYSHTYVVLHTQHFISHTQYCTVILHTQYSILHTSLHPSYGTSVLHTAYFIHSSPSFIHRTAYFIPKTS